MTRFVRTGIALTVLAVLGWLGGCSDNPGGPVDPGLSEGLIVSDPVTTAGLAAGAQVAPALAGSAADEVAYVSLAPGTVPAGRLATIRRVGDAGSIITSVRDGGFDPVPVDAQAGDFIDVLVRGPGGGTLFQQRVAVRPGRRPAVVRSDPPRGKTDVAVNAVIVVVFSEPIAGGSLTPSSVQLFRGTSAVAGTVRLLQGTGAAAAFTPTVPLSRNTDYRLVVTSAVRDLDGDALLATVSVEFTTGQSSTGPAASISVSPDTVRLTGLAYQMTATVRDAAGNMLIDQPVTWATSDPAGLTVSPTGQLTALAAGSYTVTATVNGLSASVRVFVLAGPAASVEVTPAQATVGAVGDTIALTAIVSDALGRLLDHPSVTWTSGDLAVATVAPDSSGSLGLAFATVTGVSPGSVTITATSGTASGTASITVIPPQPVASVTVTPASATLVVQATRQLSATVRDANGKVLTGRLIAWATDNAAVATVDANGLVTGVSVGAAAVTATSEGVSDTAAITVTLISLVSVKPGGGHTCGLTPIGAAYCWGSNVRGQLGIGTTTGPEECVFEVVGGSSSIPCSTTPIRVIGELTFSALSAGYGHTCGLTSTGAAYCWGYNEQGQLGNGSTTHASVPVAVGGGLTFSTLSAAIYHTCGLTTTGAAYCWGSNSYGQLGNGSATNPIAVPVAVSGGLTFSALSVGDRHTCALTPLGAAYCWGGLGGTIGNSPITGSAVPVAVSGGLAFTAVSAAAEYTCGLTTSGAAYCWGSNVNGQLGDGTRTGRASPVAVLGGLSFDAVTAGGTLTFPFGHTCGVTTGDAAYCWGFNQSGELGDGTTTGQTSPVPVLGGLSFAMVSAGGSHTCGITIGDAAYCWGWNRSGQLGNGTTTNSTVPVKVAGQP